MPARGVGRPFLSPSRGHAAHGLRALARRQGAGGIHAAKGGPSPLAYADAKLRTTNTGSAPSLKGAHADRFQGVDSRYKKNLRKSTLPIHGAEPPWPPTLGRHGRHGRGEHVPRARADSAAPLSCA